MLTGSGRDNRSVILSCTALIASALHALAVGAAYTSGRIACRHANARAPAISDIPFWAVTDSQGMRFPSLRERPTMNCILFIAYRTSAFARRVLFLGAGTWAADNNLRRSRLEEPSADLLESQLDILSALRADLEIRNVVLAAE